MNLEKVVFGFFIILAMTLNFSFVYGAVDDPRHHSLIEFFVVVVVNVIATTLKLGDRTQIGALLLATSLVADLQLIADFCLRSLYEQNRFRVAKLYYPEETNRNAVERLLERIPNMVDTELAGLLRDVMLIGQTKKGPWSDDQPTDLIAAAQRIGIDPEHVRKDQQREDAGTAVVYRNPSDPDTEWNGKGKKPLWVEAWESTGQAIEELAVEVPKKPASKKKGAKA